MRCRPFLLLRWRRVSWAAAVIIGKTTFPLLPTFLIIRCLDPRILSTLFVSSWILSVQRNSLISSSHPFLVFPRLCRYCILCWSQGSIPLHSWVNPAREFCNSHLINRGNLCFSSKNLSGCVDVFIRIVLWKSIAVVVTIRIRVVSFDTFFFWASLTFFHFFIGFVRLTFQLTSLFLSLFHHCCRVSSFFYVLLGCMMRRLNQTLVFFRECPCPEAQFTIGMITMSNKRSLWRRTYDFEINSCLYKEKVAQAAEMYSSGQDVLYFSAFVKILYFDVVNLDFFSVVRALVSENFRFPVCILSPHLFCVVLELAQHFCEAALLKSLSPKQIPIPLFFANVENRLSEPSAD